MKRIAQLAASVLVLIGPGLGIRSSHAQQAQKQDLTAAGLWLEWYRPHEVVIWKIQQVGDEFEASIIESIRPSPAHLAPDVIEPKEPGKFDIRHLKRHGLIYEGGELLSPHGRVADIKITLSPNGETGVMDESNFGSMVNGARKPDANAYGESSGLARLE